MDSIEVDFTCLNCGKCFSTGGAWVRQKFLEVICPVCKARIRFDYSYPFSPTELVVSEAENPEAKVGLVQWIVQ